MRLKALTTFFVHWSLLLEVISGMQQQQLPNKPQSSTYFTSPSNQDIGTQKMQHNEKSSSRRNLLVSIATGMTTSILPLMNNNNNSILQQNPSDAMIANAATTTTTTPTTTTKSSFRAYQVQPDSGEKLNPALTTLTVSANLSLLTVYKDPTAFENVMMYLQCCAFLFFS